MNCKCMSNADNWMVVCIRTLLIGTHIAVLGCELALKKPSAKLGSELGMDLPSMISQEN